MLSVIKPLREKERSVKWSLHTHPTSIIHPGEHATPRRILLSIRTSGSRLIKVSPPVCQPYVPQGFLRDEPPSRRTAARWDLTALPRRTCQR